MSGIDFPEYWDVGRSNSLSEQPVPQKNEDLNGNKDKLEKVRKQSESSVMGLPRDSISSLKRSLERSLGLSHSLGGKTESQLVLHDELETDPGLVDCIGGLGQLEKSGSLASLSSTSSTVSNSNDGNHGNREKRGSIFSSKENKGFRKYLGISLTLLSGLLYSLAALLVKLLKDDYHPFMISIWRFQGVFAPSILLVMYRVCYMKQPDFAPVWPLSGGREKVVAFTVLMLRGILGCWSVVLQFYSLQYLEVSDSMVITSSTSVFVTLLAHCLLGEKCAVVPVLTAILTFAGVVVISRPPMLTGEESFDQNILVGVSMALGCMILAAGILVIQRYLRTTHFSLVSLSSGLWGTVQCVALTFALSLLKLPESGRDVLYGVGLAVLTFFAQSFIIVALKFEQAGPVAVVQSCDVIFAFLWQFAFLGVVPDYFSLIGSMIIIAGVLLTAFRKCLTILPEDHRSRRRFRWLLL